MRLKAVCLATAALASLAMPADATYRADTTGVETAFRASHSGRCLDNDGGVNDQHRIVQWHCNGMNYQQWRFISTSGNVIQIRNTESGKCLDVPNSKANGTGLVQHRCHGGVNQQWVLVPGNAGVAYGTVKIVSLYSNKCVDVLGAGVNDDDIVVQWDCIVGQRNQDWLLV